MKKNNEPNWQETELGTVPSKEQTLRGQERVLLETPHFLLQIKNILELVKPNQNDYLLDIGCGTGKYEAIFSKTCKIIGIDISKETVLLAKKFAEKYGNKKNASVVLKNKPLNQLLKGKIFSKVLMIDVVEHMPQPELESTLFEIKPLMNKDSLLLVYTPNKNHWSELGRKYFGVCRTPEHINLFSAQRLVSTLEKNGFRVEAIYFRQSSTLLGFFERILPFNFLKKRICVRAKKEALLRF